MVTRASMRISGIITRITDHAICGGLELKVLRAGIEIQVLEVGVGWRFSGSRDCILFWTRLLSLCLG